jgi:hypothetical protein
LTLQDLWPETRSDLGSLDELIVQFDPEDLVQTLARINVYLQNVRAASRAERELELMPLFLPPVWATKAQWALKSGRSATLLDRLTLLAAIRRTISLAPRALRSIKPNEGRELVGQICLRLNDLVAQHESPPDRGMPPLQAAANAEAGLFRYAFYAGSEPYEVSLGRYWALIRHGLAAGAKRFGAPVDFEEIFANTFGMSWAQMSAFGFVVYTHYSEVNATLFSSPEQFIVHGDALRSVLPPEDHDRARRIFDYLSMALSEGPVPSDEVGPQDLYRLQQLYDHPLFVTRRGGIFAMDTQLLRARITEGAYWALFGHLLGHDVPKRAYALRDAFGHATEWYAAQVLGDAMPATGAEQRLWLAWNNDLEGVKGGRPDAVVLENGTFYFFEITSSFVRPGEASSGSGEVLAAALRRVWLGDGDEGASGKLVQLQRGIHAFRSGAWRLAGYSGSTTLRIVPILVSLRSVPQVDVLDQWYRSLMSDGALQPWFLKDLRFFDLADVEQMAQASIAKLSWNAILAAHASSPYRDSSIFSYIVESGMLRDKNRVLAKYIDEAAKSIARTIAITPTKE